MEPFKGKPSNEKKIKPIKEQKDWLVALLVHNRDHSLKPERDFKNGLIVFS